MNDSNPEIKTLNECWTRFGTGLASRDTRLLREIEAGWTDLAAQMNTAEQLAIEIGMPPATSGTLLSLQWLYRTAKPRLLDQTIRTYQSRQTLSRIFKAFEDYRTDLAEVARILPAQIEVTGAELATLLGIEDPLTLLDRWRIRRRSERQSILFRQIVLDLLRERDRRRSSADETLLLQASRTALRIPSVWQDARTKVLVVNEPGGLTSTPAKDRLEKPDARAFNRFRDWARNGTATLARNLLARSVPVSEARAEALSDASSRVILYWARMGRAVDSALQLEAQFATLGSGLFDEAESALDQIDSERSKLMAEISATQVSLRAGELGLLDEVDRRAGFSAAEERLNQWSNEAVALAKATLPGLAEVAEPVPLSTRWLAPWRELQPALLFERRLQNLRAAKLIAGLKEIEFAQTAVMRDLERAREVAAFGAELAASEGTEGARMAAEATANAVALLDHRQETVPDLRQMAEQNFALLHATLFADCYAALELGQAGLFARWARQRGRRAWQRGWQAAVIFERSAALETSSAAARLAQDALIRVGLTTPPRPHPEPFTERASMSAVSELQFAERSLPGLYRRLFRVEPVEDARFLVGRQAELAALAHAREKWKSGGAAPVLLIGARGSGKTSLLNCAISSLFAGDSVVRSGFRDRLTQRFQLYDFLRGVLNLPAGADLVAALIEEPRVIILEELERTFLRVTGGFEAIRALLDLVYATSHRVLWILCTNEMAFRYLKAPVELDRHFVYQICSASVRQEDLTAAILQRHGLSGLRLEFDVPEGGGRLEKLQTFLGLNRDSQALFFDSLYDQSEGIFRSAFDLWQASIVQIGGGVVRMRQPLIADFRELFSDLNLDDHFALQATLHHGSLTAQELSLVLNLPAERAERLLDRLQQMGILEDEPTRPGLRVRREATRVVREILHAQNLSLESTK